MKSTKYEILIHIVLFFFRIVIAREIHKKWRLLITLMPFSDKESPLEMPYLFLILIILG